MPMYYPDPTLRQPLTLVAVFPVLLCYYALAVLAILPNTFIFKLLLLPFILWQASRCAIGYDCAPLEAQMAGLQSTDSLRLSGMNMFFVTQMTSISLRSIEWTFTKRPLRRYEPRKRERGPLIERRKMSTTSVLLDAFDLMFNMRGIGWSWSSNPFPHSSTPPPSITFVLFNTVLLLTVLDAAQYVLQYVRPAVNNPRGGSIFDPSLALVPRTALATFCGIVGGIWIYATIDFTYHLAALVGRIIFRQPASAWPPAFHQPWMSTSVKEFWGFRWHQFWRHNFIVFGARPGSALLGRPSAVMGAFIVSSILHHISLWSFGNGTEFVTAGGFFLVMGIGVIMEGVFTKATGLRVRGWLGRSWAIMWMTLWSTVMMDGWARHGLMADNAAVGLRPGKIAVDAIIVLSGMR